MTSEIRVNKLTNRIGLSTVTFADSGIGVTVTGRIDPDTDSARDLGTTSVRWRNAYVDTYYGDGSNLTGLSGVSVANQSNNRLITATGTTDALNGEANLTFDGTTLTVSGNASANAVQSSFGGITTRLGFVSGSAEGVVETTSNHSLVLGVNSNEKLRIDSNGYLSFAGDTDTYIHHPQANQLAITLAGGSFPIVRFGTGGSGSTVGFSTTNTLVTNAERISVRGYSSFKSDSNVYAAIYTHNEGNTSGTYNAHLLWNAGGANRGGIGYMPNNGELIFNNQNAINFATGATHLDGTTRFRITSSGETQIKGDANPCLSVDRGSANNTNINLLYNGTTRGQVSVASAAFNLGAVGTNTPIKFYANGDNHWQINESNVLYATGGSTKQGSIHINYGNANQTDTDAVVYISRTSNNDWSFKANAYAGTATDYCYYAQVGNGAAYAYGAKDQQNNVWRFRVAGNGTIFATNTSISSISDRRLKENIVDANSQWNDIKALKWRNFTWKNDTDTAPKLGLIADEVESISPNLIEIDAQDKEDKDNGVPDPKYKTVKYSIVWMKAMKALQEAQERIEKLEQENIALRARVTNLEGN